MPTSKNITRMLLLGLVAATIAVMLLTGSVSRAGVGAPTAQALSLTTTAVAT